MAAMLHELAGYVGLALDAVAVLSVAAGAAIAAAESCAWLVAALTFQLGSDIVSTTIAPTWDDLGRLAAVAGIRTFLIYFLDRDLERAIKPQQNADARPGSGSRPEQTSGAVDGLPGSAAVSVSKHRRTS